VIRNIITASEFVRFLGWRVVEGGDVQATHADCIAGGAPPPASATPWRLLGVAPDRVSAFRSHHLSDGWSTLDRHSPTLICISRAGLRDSGRGSLGPQVAALPECGLTSPTCVDRRPVRRWFFASTYNLSEACACLSKASAVPSRRPGGPYAHSDLFQRSRRPKSGTSTAPRIVDQHQSARGKPMRVVRRALSAFAVVVE
jgi:hypothetical protein